MLEECNYNPEETENIIASELSLESDYIFDILGVWGVIAKDARITSANNIIIGMLVEKSLFIRYNENRL